MPTSKKDLSYTLWSSIFAAAVLWSGTVWAAASPREVIQTTTDHVVAVFQDSPSHTGTQDQKRLEKMWETVLPSFDTEEIARRALGVHWNTLTRAQRQHFTQLFTQLVQQNYNHTMEQYLSEAQFSIDQERIEGDFAEVPTRIQMASQKKSLSMTYRLHHTSGRWLVYDVLVDHISMVQNYRAQFRRLLHNSSYEGLVRALEEKLRELAS
jgi:phospholipid transport system substrate-binding protein